MEFIVKCTCYIRFCNFRCTQMDSKKNNSYVCCSGSLANPNGRMTSHLVVIFLIVLGAFYFGHNYCTSFITTLISFIFAYSYEPCREPDRTQTNRGKCGVSYMQSRDIHR